MFSVVLCRWQTPVCAETGSDGCERTDEISGRRGYLKACKSVLSSLISSWKRQTMVDFMESSSQFNIQGDKNKRW